jgi:hypothetical protein
LKDTDVVKCVALCRLFEKGATHKRGEVFTTTYGRAKALHPDVQLLEEAETVAPEDLEAIAAKTVDSPDSVITTLHPKELDSDLPLKAETPPEKEETEEKKKSSKKSKKKSGK